MSLDTDVVPAADGTPVQGDLLEAAASPLALSLQDFVAEFGDELLNSLNRANPPVYTGQARPHRQLVLASLKRKLFQAQAEVVHAVTELLADRGERAAIVNGEMGCGKTTVGIATAAVLHAEGYRRTLVLSPPHLVYKWRREIQETVAGAKVWVLNGPDTLVKLIKLREQLGVPARGQEFFVLGRVRMRMGFHWKPVFNVRRTRHGEVGTCPDCGQVITNLDGEPINPVELEAEDYRRRCSHCAAPLWTLMRPRSLSASDQSTAVFKALQRIPTIGEVTAQKLMRKFGDSFLASMLGDNIHEFINLMDGNGELGSRIARRTAWSGRWRTWSSASARAATSRPSSSSATCRKARSTCSSPTRRTSTRTAAPHRAKRWGCWRPRHARRCCSPAR